LHSLRNKPLVWVKPHWWTLKDCETLFNEVMKDIFFCLFVDAAVALLNYYDASSGITIVHDNGYFEISVVIDNIIIHFVEEKDNPLQAILDVLNSQSETSKSRKKIYYVTSVEEPVGFVESIVETVKKQFNCTIQTETPGLTPLYLMTEGAKNYGLSSNKLFLVRGDKFKYP